MRGQEFDVFKLLISAMIAVAILMILQQVLNQVGGIGTDLKTVIKQELNACEGDCSPRTKQIRITMTKDSQICAKDLKDTPADSIEFEVDGINGLEGGDCLTATESVKNKNALLKVWCENGECHVLLEKP